MSWKEAATLILVRPFSKNLVRRPSHFSSNEVLKSMVKFQEMVDYEIYVGVRSAKSKFFPNSLVFPGGAVEKMDFDATEWNGLLNETNTVPSPCRCVRLPMYDQYYKLAQSSKNNLVDPQIAFRLCAIREFAEETGIAVVSKSQSSPPNSSQTRHFFADFLAKTGYLPGVNMLYDWRNFLTPKAELGLKNVCRRFDTIFYMAFIDNETTQIINMPNDDDEELLRCRWATVPELLTDFLCGNLTLPPPQLNELATLLRYPKYDDLKRFVTNKMAYDKLHRWLPILARFAGKPSPQVVIIPGDSCYPKTEKEALEIEQLDFDDSFEENCRKSERLYRVKFVNGSQNKGQVNYLELFCNLNILPTGQLSALSDFCKESLQATLD